ncbi:MAG: hypothetical protein M1837_002181 [Sclerophora amabilis]|nr:MAG: hypothetical protein M1837_002181 [Sclerophora amabilis]
MSSAFHAAYGRAVTRILDELKDPSDSIHDCGAPSLQLLSSRVPARLNDLIHLAHDKLHAFPFKDVPTCWRRLYTDASILKAGEERDQGDEDPVATLDLAIILTGAPKRRELIEELLAAIDEDQQQQQQPWDQDDAHPSKRRKLTTSMGLGPGPETLQPGSSSVPKINRPIATVPSPSSLSLSAFTSLTTPLIIKDAVTDWPAFERWKCPAYLLGKTLNGRRLVPVEIGRSYTDDGWGQKIVPFSRFLEDYVLANSVVGIGGGYGVKGRQTGAVTGEGITKQVGYLAQHDLFAQIPSLKNDVLIPDYCYTTGTPNPPPSVSPSLSIDGFRKDDDDDEESAPGDEGPYLNAWFGPAGTVSPLHTDPYRNVFCQVVGRKYVRLYAPDETSKLYPRGVEEGGVDMGNTSMVDVEEEMERDGLGEPISQWDGADVNEKQQQQHSKTTTKLTSTNQDKPVESTKFPKFKDARYVEGILEAGESLYIPVSYLNSYQIHEPGVSPCSPVSIEPSNRSTN